MPEDVQFINCTAIDDGGTMRWGFFVDNEPGLVMHTINPHSEGHIEAYAHLGGADANFMPTMFGAVIPEAIHIGGTQYPAALMQLSELGNGTLTLPLYLKNAWGTAGTEVGISLDPTGDGKNTRDALIVGGTTGSSVTYLSFRVAAGGAPSEVMRVTGTGLGIWGETLAGLQAGRKWSHWLCSWQFGNAR